MARKKRPAGRRPRPVQNQPQASSHAEASEDASEAGGEAVPALKADGSEEGQDPPLAQEEPEEDAEASSEQEDAEEGGGGFFDGESFDGPGLSGHGVLEEAEVEDTEQYLKGLVEAILFSSDKPQSSRDVARAAKMDKLRVEELIEQLQIETKDRGVRLVQVQEGYAFRTNPAYSPFVREFLSQRPVRLSRAQLETLAIIAYRQPITRPEVDDIRGVDSGAVLKTLLERELVRILGKKDEPGRPMIYGTAPGFLDLFSLNSLRDLPTLREFTELSEDSRAKFEMEIGEPAPEGPVDLSEFEERDDTQASEDTAPEALLTGEELPEGEDEDGGQESDDDSDEQESDDEQNAEDSEDVEDSRPALNQADEDEFPDDEDEDDEDDDDEDDEDDEDDR